MEEEGQEEPSRSYRYRGRLAEGSEWMVKARGRGKGTEQGKGE